MTPDLGWLIVTTQRIETGDGECYYAITGAKWDGPPLTRIDDQVLYQLPDWAIALDGELIQVGPYILRATGVFDFSSRGEYYALVDGGEVYELWWRTWRFLDFVWRRLLLTMAVWDLAKWPQAGTYPTWGDVTRRWKK